MIHRRESPGPRLLALCDPVVPLRAPLVPCLCGQLTQKLRRHQFGVTADRDRNRLRETDAVRIDIDLNHRRRLGPVVEPIARQCRKRIQARAEREHDVGLRDQFHRRARAVVAQGPDAQRMLAGEGIVVLIVVADRRLQLFRERHALGNRIAEHNAGSREDHRKPGLRQQARGFGNRPATPGRSLELERRRAAARR